MLNKGRRVVENIHRSSQLLESIQEGVSNQSDLLNRKLSEMIDLMRRREQAVDAESALRPLRPVGAKPDIEIPPMRPVGEIAKYPDIAPRLSFESITEWHQSPTFKTVREYFHHYPQKSLMDGIGRELMYHMLRTIKPKVAIEVGTYHAGTSEVIVRAMAENERGMLHTTDPFGQERCPYIIESWPEALRRHITYYPLK